MKTRQIAVERLVIELGRRMILITLLSFAYSHSYSQHNTVECPNPPGGRVTCDYDQVAVCLVDRGEIIGLCLTIPSDLSSSQQIVDWVLFQQLGLSDKFVRELTLYQDGSRYEFWKPMDWNPGWQHSPGDGPFLLKIRLPPR